MTSTLAQATGCQPLACASKHTPDDRRAPSAPPPFLRVIKMTAREPGVDPGSRYDTGRRCVGYRSSQAAAGPGRLRIPPG